MIIKVMITTIVFFLIVLYHLGQVVCFALCWFFLEPLCHEIGHALTLNKFEKCSAIVFYKKNKKCKKTWRGIDIYYVNNPKYDKITYSVSNYANLNNEQIIKVAKGGVRATCFLWITLTVLSAVLHLLIFLGGCLLVLGLLSLIKLKILKPKNNDYNDFDIIKDPEEFKLQNKIYSPDNKRLYENLLREYNN